MELYADNALEKALGIRFRQPAKREIEEVRNIIATIAHRMSVEVPEIQPPRKGFLENDLTELREGRIIIDQKKALNAALGPKYADANISQQKEIMKIDIEESHEKMVPLREVIKDFASVQYTSRPYEDACGDWANKHRILYVRQGVAFKFAEVCRALNEAGLKAFVQDCWRPPEVQSGLFMRRVIHVARSNPDWDWEQVERVAKSFTASMPSIAGHQAGAAIDWILSPLEGDRPLPLGNKYPEGEAHSSLDFPYLTFEIWKTRHIFEQVMRMGNFKLLRTEDWHGSYGDRGLGMDGETSSQKAIYGPIQSFDQESGKVLQYDEEIKDIIFLERPFVEKLIQESREKVSGGHWRFTFSELLNTARERNKKGIGGFFR